MSTLRNGKRATVSSNSQIWSITQAPSSKSTTAHLQTRTLLGTLVVGNIPYPGTIFFYQYLRYTTRCIIHHQPTYLLSIYSNTPVYYIFCERLIENVRNVCFLGLDRDDYYIGHLLLYHNLIIPRIAWAWYWASSLVWCEPLNGGSLRSGRDGITWSWHYVFREKGGSMIGTMNISANSRSGTRVNRRLIT